MNARKICTIIGSDKGGVGKSMIAQVMTLVFDNAKFPLRVVEIDNQRKLSSVLGTERINLSLTATPDLEDISRRRQAAESFFNPAYMEWVKGNSMTDLGANVTTSLLTWFRYCQIDSLAAEDNIDFRFVACTSPDEQALKSAMTAINDARETFGASAKYFVVLNETGGYCGFEPYKDNPSYRKIMDMAASDEISAIEIPYCDSMLLEHGKAMDLNLVDIVNQADVIATKAALDTVSSRVHKRKMIAWLQQTQANLTPLLNFRLKAVA